MDHFQIEYLNLKAVESFQHGDLVTTKVSLMEALRYISEVNDSDKIMKNDPQQHTCPPTRSQTELLTKPNHNNNNEKCTRTYSIRPDDQNSIPFPDIYNGMFVLTNQVLPVNVHVSAAIILFNFGLLHHREAIQLNSAKEYSHALQAYLKAFQIFKTLNGDDSKTATTLVVVMAALFHNMSQIYTTFFRMLETRAVLELLEQTLSCLETMPHLISDDDFCFFQVNLRFSRMDDFRIAPAA